MSSRNPLIDHPPHRVHENLVRLGANLKRARLRRNLTLEELAQKIGVGRHSIADAEKGKPSTSIVIYAGILWALGKVDEVGSMVDPATDAEGIAIEARSARQRARQAHSTDLSNDF